MRTQEGSTATEKLDKERLKDYSTSVPNVSVLDTGPFLVVVNFHRRLFTPSLCFFLLHGSKLIKSMIVPFSSINISVHD